MMKEFKGTKGHWEVAPNIFGEPIVYSTDELLKEKFKVSKVLILGADPREGAIHANAKLIAAAPELLEALCQLHKFLTNPDYAAKKDAESLRYTDGNIDFLNDVLITNAESAIKKALEG